MTLRSSSPSRTISRGGRHCNRRGRRRTRAMRAHEIEDKLRGAADHTIGFALDIPVQYVLVQFVEIQCLVHRCELRVLGRSLIQFGAASLSIFMQHSHTSCPMHESAHASPSASSSFSSSSNSVRSLPLRSFSGCEEGRPCYSPRLISGKQAYEVVEEQENSRDLTYFRAASVVFLYPLVQAKIALEVGIAADGVFIELQ